MLSLINLTVIAIKGEFNANGKHIEPKYVLFSDNETYIEFEDQDYYTYHDCSSSAKHINVYKNAEQWAIIQKYKDATTTF